MSLTSTEVKLAPNGHVYLGLLGATLPTDATAAINASLIEVGYIDEKGVTITPKLTTNEISAWQSALPVKIGVKTVSLDAKFTMLQDNGTTAGAWFLDQSFTYNAGTAKLTVPAAPTLVERSLVIEWIDDANLTNRLVFGRCLITDRDNLTLDRTNPTAYGITVAALADASNNMAYFYSQNTEYLIAS